MLLNGLLGGLRGVTGNGFSMYMFMIESTGDSPPGSVEDGKGLSMFSSKEDVSSRRRDGRGLFREDILVMQGQQSTPRRLEQHDKCSEEQTLDPLDEDTCCQ